MADKDTASKRQLIDTSFEPISAQRQCELVGLPTSSFYYQPCTESDLNLKLMRLMDEQYLKTPFYGYRKMHAHLQQMGFQVNLKRVHRLWRLMGLESLSPKPDTSRPVVGHKVYPYLLRGVSIERKDHVWSTDITYIPMERGFLYLVAVIDWYSRYVLSWRLSNSMDTSFCIECLRESLACGTPEIFNTDQGAQFTSDGFTQVLKDSNVRISMDGKGRAVDNVFVERLWRSVKYEYVYLNGAGGGMEMLEGLRDYFHYYNHERPHQSLNYQTPASIYQHE